MNSKVKSLARLRRHFRLRKTISGTATCPRLVVYRSNRHFYAQIINDQTGQTLLAYSTLKLVRQKQNATLQTVQTVAAELAKLAQQHQITRLVFDRAGFLYHGQIAHFAATMRQKGLKL